MKGNIPGTKYVHYFDYLREVRIASGRTMSEASEGSQIGDDVRTRASLSLLSKVERGQVRDPRIATVVKLARAYRVSVADFEQFFTVPKKGKDRSQEPEGATV